jgi:hypothetical protein
MSDVETIFHGIHDGRAVWERRQDCEPAVELAKMLSDAKTQSDWGRVVGVVPAVKIQEWMIEDGVNVLGMPEPEFRAFIRKKLADPDNRKFVVKY